MIADANRQIENTIRTIREAGREGAYPVGP